MSVADAISSLGATPYVLTRRTVQPLDAAGREQPPLSTTLGIRALVQPLSGTDLERLPEGTRASDFIVIFTTSGISTVDTAAGRDADLITYRGEQYEVESVEPWEEAGGYFRAVARKVKP